MGFGSAYTTVVAVWLIFLDGPADIHSMTFSWLPPESAALVKTLDRLPVVPDKTAPTLKTLLLQAFDEGASSPCDLRESIVDALLKDVPEGQMNKLPDLERMTKTIAEYLPPPIREVVKYQNIWLCGGGVLHVLCNPHARDFKDSWKNSDWDFFCAPKMFDNWYNQSNQLRQLNVNKTSDQYKFTNITGYIESHKVNFILSKEFTSPIGIISDFDLTLVQFAYSEGSLTLGPNTWRDILAGQIRLTRPVGNTQVNKVANRVRKYISRGFRDCTGLVEQGLLSGILREAK